MLGSQTSADILFSHPDPVTVSKGNVIGTTPIVDSMHFEFDVVVHSIQSSGWGNIFQVQEASSSDVRRMPALWIHDQADNSGATLEGWYLQFEDDTDSSLGDEPVVAGKSYHFEMDWTQTAIFVKINGKTVWDASTSTHQNYDSFNVYVSNPQYTTDATVSNFVISTDLSCWVAGYECESYEACGDDGECGRDCSAFQIDDYLLDCSAEFEGNENDIASLQSDISEINTNIQAIETTLDGKADSSTTEASIQELKDSIADIEQHLHLLSGGSAHSVPGMVDGAAHLDAHSMKWTLTGKDMTIIALLMVNLVIMVTLFVVCRTGSGGKYVFEQ